MSLLANLRAPHGNTGKQKHNSPGWTVAFMPQCRSRRSSLGCLGSAVAAPNSAAGETASWFGGRTWQYIPGAAPIPSTSRNIPTAPSQQSPQKASGTALNTDAGRKVTYQTASTSNTYSVCTYNVLGDSYVSAHPRASTVPESMSMYLTVVSVRLRHASWRTNCDQTLASALELLALITLTFKERQQLWYISSGRYPGSSTTFNHAVP